MTISSGKTTGVTAALLTVLAMAVALVALPTATAQTSVKTYAFIGATPNPVGVNQEVLIHVGIPQQLFIVSHGWEGLSVTIERPDGKTDTITDIRTDATGGTGRTYTPTMTGNYTLQSHFPQQTTTDTKRASQYPVGTVMLASDSDKLILIVQEDPIPYYPGHALPTEYWTRPINAQFHEWVPITGNWLRPAGGYTMPPIPKYHPNNEDAPETAHILWTKQYALGGLAGSELGNVQYEMGDAYEGKFAGSVILNGVRYYNQFE